MNEVFSFAVMWMDLENIMLSEVSQKDKVCMTSLTCEIKKIKQMNTTSKAETDSQI